MDLSGSWSETPSTLILERNKDPVYESTGMPEIKSSDRVLQAKGGRFDQYEIAVFITTNLITVGNLLE